MPLPTGPCDIAPPRLPVHAMPSTTFTSLIRTRLLWRTPLSRWRRARVVGRTAARRVRCALAGHLGVADGRGRQWLGKESERSGRRGRAAALAVRARRAERGDRVACPGPAGGRSGRDRRGVRSGLVAAPGADHPVPRRVRVRRRGAGPAAGRRGRAARHRAVQRGRRRGRTGRGRDRDPASGRRPVSGAVRSSSSERAEAPARRRRPTRLLPRRHPASAARSASQGVHGLSMSFMVSVRANCSSGP